MLFYEDLVKKVKESKIENLKEKYVFRLNITKFLPHIIILAFVLFSLPFLYTIYKAEGLSAFILLMPVLGAVSVIQIMKNLKFKFEIKNGSLFYQTIEIKLDEIKSCNLKFGLLPKGKKMLIFLDIITINKEEKIIPLNMGNKVLFVMVLKELLGTRFEVIEEK